MGSNFAESDGDSAGLGRNHLPSSEIQSHTGFFLNLTFATPKPLKELAQGKSSKILTFAHHAISRLIFRGFPLVSHRAVDGASASFWLC
jgi:hypothetical protein